MSALAASTEYATIAFNLVGSESYLVLLNVISNCSAFWWKLCSMHTLDTSGKPSRRSELALLNSAASISPRSIAGTISAPGSATTAAPMAWNMSIEMPTVRYFMPLKSSGLVTGFLNQPSGCVGCGPYGKDTTLAPMELNILESNSLPPPYLCQDSIMFPSMPKAGLDPHSARAFCLP